MASVTEPHAAGIELNGINVIDESERKGTPRSLFWPWFAANVSVLALSYGSYVLGFGVSLWQAIVAGVVGIVLSFVLCGFISIAGRRGSAPTMVLSRSAFGVNGNRLPAAISWVLCVGWETVLTALAAEATATVFARVGVGGGNGTKVIAFIVVAFLIVGGGVAGFNLIMRMQAVITVITAILTVLYIALELHRVHWHAVSSMHSASVQDLIGATILPLAGFGLGWVNCAADYSRYLPRRSSASGVVWWTTFGASVAPVILLIFGFLLAASSKNLNAAIDTDPVGALTTVLPTWFLVPFAIVAVLGLVGGAVLDIYSSGLTLLSVGLPFSRIVAACIDGTIMVLGTIYILFIASNDFLYHFLEGFLITLAVPIGAWCGVMLADIVLRRRDYDDTDLYNPKGRYGSVQLMAVLLLVVGCGVGFGLVTASSTSSLYTWQGYLLGPFGLGGKTGAWAYSDLGVAVALALGFVGWLILGARTVRHQESLPATSPAGAVV
jgi:nucleobase:cation symporter-1, NCS1 family